MNSAELIKLLTADGWVLRSVKGSHHVYTHPAKPGHLSVPHPRKDLAACRTFLASAPEALLALSFDGYSDHSLAFRGNFRVHFRQKAVRPFGLRVWTASAALRRLPMEEPLAARRALHPSAHPHNASHVKSPTGC